jgi:hypothetical protein
MQFYLEGNYMQNPFLTILFSQLGHYLPGFILDIVGISISIVSYRKSPQKFLLTTISFSIFFLNSLANLIFYTWTTTKILDKTLSATQAGLNYQLSDCISTPIWLTAWVILFVVIFNKKYNSEKNIHEQNVVVANNFNGEQ